MPYVNYIIIIPYYTIPKHTFHCPDSRDSGATVDMLVPLLALFFEVPGPKDRFCSPTK